MSRPSRELSPFSHLILVLVGEGGAGAHDLMRMMRRGRIYWAAAPSHFYSEPKRLAELGYLRSRKEPGQTRQRTIYELTAKGRKAIRKWLKQRSAFVRIQNEPVVRLLGTDLAEDRADVLGSLQPLREEIAELSRDLDEAEGIAEGIPERERFLQLNSRLSRRILAAFDEWLDEVEAELSE